MHKLLKEAMQEEQDSIIQELQEAGEARQKALQDAETLRKQQLLVEAQQKAEQEAAEKLLKEQEEARQKLLQEEEAKLAEQKRQTAKLKLQKERERFKREALERQLEYVKQREAAIERKFRERLSSEDSSQSLSKENLGKLTDRQITGTLIKKDSLQTKLRKITNAFRYVQMTGTKLDDETLQRYEHVRKRVAKQLNVCNRLLEAQRVKTPEQSHSTTPNKVEEDQEILTHSPIQREHVSPIGRDTIPPKFRVTTPLKYNGEGLGPSPPESIKERIDALQKVHEITNGHTTKPTLTRLEDLSKQAIRQSDKRTLRVPDTTNLQLVEFLLNNPGIIDPEQLDWAYEEEGLESQDGSYKPQGKRGKLKTPSFSTEQYQITPSMGLPSSPMKSSLTTPRTPKDTLREGNVNIRESNWRQGRSNIQSASDTLKRDTIDLRRVKLPPGQDPPTNYPKPLPRYSCKFCYMRHTGRICPCVKCGWIHLTLECPEIPYETYEQEEPQYPNLLRWGCGQVGHYIRECCLPYHQTRVEYDNVEKPFMNGKATYPLKVDTGPQIVDGYLYRPKYETLYK